ncbi:glycosyltransferase [Flavobacteriaceae bacterium F08102]|nr:glycosyltransferase [Flavobacteriaceae bacterium F08102]
MRILFYIESLRAGGKERRLVELIKSLSKQADVEIGLVLTTKEIHYTAIYETRTNIFYTERKGIKKDPRVFYKFYKVAKKFNPDVIHVWGNMVAIYAIPTKLLLSVPMINSQITSVPMKVSKSLLGHTIPFKFSDLIIANTQAGLNAFKAPSDKSMVIYNGFDFTRINGLKNPDRLKEELQIKTKYVVGMVATIYEKKDYDSYVKAAVIILKQRLDVTFLCIGEGETHALESLIPKAFKNHIRFLGKISDTESYMNMCDIGILATFTEGISNALLEFMALKKPVIGTGVGGTVELLTGENGILLPAKQPEKLAVEINGFLEDAGKRKTFGQKAFETVGQKFNVLDKVNEYRSVYDRIRNV